MIPSPRLHSVPEQFIVTVRFVLGAPGARRRSNRMSNSPETGLDLEDLELQLLPAWAKQSPDTNRYAKYEGGEESGPRGRDRGERRARMPGRPLRGDAR